MNLKKYFFIYILLISQLWVSVDSSISLLFDNENIIELVISDKEIEDDNKEDKKDKIINNFECVFIIKNFIKINNNFNKKENFISSSYIEIHLPPPEHDFYYI